MGLLSLLKQSEGTMKIGIWISLCLFVIGVGVALIQLWFSPWESQLFIKFEMTIGAFLAIALVIIFVIREYNENKKNRSGKDLN